jgi:hypothetical protein
MASEIERNVNLGRRLDADHEPRYGPRYPTCTTCGFMVQTLAADLHHLPAPTELDAVERWLHERE